MPDLKKLLMPVDFSDRSEGLARYAQEIASRFCSQIILLHVENDPLIGGRPADQGHPPGSIEHKLWLKKRLDSHLKEDLPSAAVTRIVTEGDPAGRIVEVALAEQVDLILMATTGHRALRQLLWGSVLAKVIQDSNCPVWTGVHLTDAPPRDRLSFKRVACAVDLGPQTRSALSWASEFASAFGALLSVVHVAKSAASEQVELPSQGPEPRVARYARAELEYLLDDMKIKADIATGAGSAPALIHEFALQLEADVLVIGRCPSSSWLHSDTYTIIRESHCPVVSV
jgi:nucleotide-binding universal stress UspA family protein